SGAKGQSPCAFTTKTIPWFWKLSTPEKGFRLRCKSACLIPSSPPRKAERDLAFPSRRESSRSTAVNSVTKPNSIAAQPLPSSCRTLMNMKSRILLIEDDASTAASLKKVLCAEDYEVETTGRGDAGLELARQNEYSVVISDLRLPGLGGLDLVAQLHASKPKQPIILMTAHGTTETAIEATKL